MTAPAPVAAIVLAAGGGTRFGGDKLLASLGGRPVVRLTVGRVLRSGARPVLVVTGHAGDAVAAALAGLDVRLVPNAAWAGGMAGSLRAGVAALPDECAAAVVLLGDQPLIEPDAIDRVAAAFRAAGRPIVAARYGGRRGHPVLFARALFGELAAVTGDIGAREVIARDPSRVELVELPGEPPPDVDTPDDLARLEARS